MASYTCISPGKLNVGPVNNTGAAASIYGLVRRFEVHIHCLGCQNWSKTSTSVLWKYTIFIPGSTFISFRHRQYSEVNVSIITSLDFSYPWWRYQLETFSALLAICAGNSPVTGESPTQRPVTRSFDVFFDICLNKRFSKQSWGWWFETPVYSSWRHCNALKSSHNLIVWGKFYSLTIVAWLWTWDFDEQTYVNC